MNRHGGSRPITSGGFTLVESLVAMVLALIVLGAVTALYLGSSQSARFQTSVQRMEENGRLAVDMISRNLSMAAYDDPLNAFEVEQPLMLGTAGSSGALIALPDLKASVDTIAVRYEGGTRIRDCLGAPVAEGTYVTNVFGVNQNSELICGTSAGNATPLVEGIEDMQLSYGVDLNGDGISNQFVGPADVADWNQVVTMRVALLVSSVTDALAEVDTVCLGCTVFAGSADRKMRTEFHTVIGLRNQ